MERTFTFTFTLNVHVYGTALRSRVTKPLVKDSDEPLCFSTITTLSRTRSR
jgi:hypothetical protein